MLSKSLDQEVDRNYDFFQRHLAEFVAEHKGRYALLRKGKILGFFDRADDAERRGEDYKDGLYSIQLVDPQPVHLGAYTNG